MPTLEEWQHVVERDVVQRSRAPHFVVKPAALVDVRNEIRRIRGGKSTPGREVSDSDRPIFENALVLAEKLEDARLDLGPEDHEELARFVDERLVEASLRFG